MKTKAEKKVRLVAHVEPETASAFKRLADAHERTTSAELRLLVRQALARATDGEAST